MKVFQDKTLRYIFGNIPSRVCHQNIVKSIIANDIENHVNILNKLEYIETLNNMPLCSDSFIYKIIAAKEVDVSR